MILLWIDYLKYFISDISFACPYKWGLILYQTTKFESIYEDDKFNVAIMLISFYSRIKNIAGYQHFLLFPQCLQKLCLSGR